VTPRTLTLALPLACALAAFGLSCGYNLTSKGSNLPAHVKMIGVPPFRNQTTRPELAERITENVISELVARGKYKVTTDTRGVDAVLSGVVLSWTSKPVALSEETDEPERVTVTLEASVTFDDRVLRRVTWQEDKYRFTSDYDVIGDPDDYFDTELGAIEEVAEDFAQAVVSAILQGF
jgi:hypothetical protein